MADQHYLNPPQPCAVGGCECTGFGAARKVGADALQQRLPIDRIESSPLNPRKRFAQDALDELAASLEADGLLQPIVVTTHQDSTYAAPRYVIVAGERRWRAAKLLGWTEMPAIVRHDVDQATHIRLALLENLARTDLDPLEEAEGYRQLNELGMTQAAIAAAVHRSQPAIANAIRLLRAPHEIMDRLTSGELTVSHVLALLKYEQFPGLMRRLAEMAVDDDLTTKDLEGELPNRFELVREGLIRDLHYGAHFDKSVCDACPFDARRKEGSYLDVCFKPDHYDQLEAEAQQKITAKNQRELAKATASGKQLPKLDKLPYDSFTRIGNRAPEGCSEACACRGAGIGYGGAIEQICTDPKRFKRLSTAAQRAEAKVKNAQLKALLDRLNDKLDLIEVIGERELAIVATAALSTLQTADWREAVKWSGGLLEVSDFENYRERAALPGKLARLAPADLVKMAVYSILHHELRNALQGYGTGDKPRSDWYLADQPPRPPKPKGKPLVEAFGDELVCAKCGGDDHSTRFCIQGTHGFSADDHLVDEIAAEQERLERETERDLAGAVS